MSMASPRRHVTIVALTALAVIIILRLFFLIWAWEQSPTTNRSLWLIETVAISVVLSGSVAACGWLMNRLRRQDREESRLAHLAEIGLMASGLAHEIRNTLNAMHSHLALLRKNLSGEGRGDSPAWRRIGQLEHALKDMEELVSDFLAYARPAQDRLEAIDVAELLRGVSDFIALDLEQSRVKLVTEYQASLPPVHADATKLKRAVLNLMVNARQAMPDGGTLTVRLRAIERNEIVIEIQDTGCGIPEKERPRIFETFFSTKPGGSGLGLAVVRRTVEDCGGRISFDSEVGRGTTFRIQLPAARSRRVISEDRVRQPAEAIS